MTTTPIWRLRGATDKVVECFIEPKSRALHAVTVVFRSETFLDEIYPDPTSATTRAMQVRDRLLKTGDWTVPTGGISTGDSARSHASVSSR